MAKKPFTSKFIAPLRNFHCDVTTISLPDNYCIRKTSQHENDFLESLRKNYFLPLGENDYVLEIPVELEKEYQGEEAKRNNEKGSNLLEDGIRILRLYKAGLIGFDCILKALSDSTTPGLTSFYSARYLTRILVSPNQLKNQLVSVIKQFQIILSNSGYSEHFYHNSITLSFFTFSSETEIKEPII